MSGVYCSLKRAADKNLAPEKGENTMIQTTLLRQKIWVTIAAMCLIFVISILQTYSSSITALYSYGI